MSIQKTVRPALAKKMRLAEKVADLIKKYNVIAVFSLKGVRANTIHEMRKKLRGTGEIIVVKKSIFSKACKLSGKEDLEKLVKDIKDPVGFIFSTMNSFRLALTLEKSKVPMYARAGEKADFDVWVPETNTGLPPGPILSDFGKLKIPTRIEGGQVWIAKDTLVAKKGDEISQLLASLLVKLDIKAVLRGITILRSYEDGVILKGEDLIVDLEKVREEVGQAHLTALNLSLIIGYLSSETIPLLLVKAAREALTLATNVEYITKETIPLIVAKAIAEAAALEKAIGPS